MGDIGSATLDLFTSERNHRHISPTRRFFWDCDVKGIFKTTYHSRRVQSCQQCTATSRFQMIFESTNKICISSQSGFLDPVTIIESQHQNYTPLFSTDPFFAHSTLIYSHSFSSTSILTCDLGHDHSDAGSPNEDPFLFCLPRFVHLKIDGAVQSCTTRHPPSVQPDTVSCAQRQDPHTARLSALVTTKTTTPCIALPSLSLSLTSLNRNSYFIPPRQEGRPGPLLTPGGFMLDLF